MPIRGAKLSRILREVRPETFYQVLADHLPGILPTAFEIFRRNQPNTCHHAIAGLLSKRLVPVALTTNFDLEIEHCLADSSVRVLRERGQFSAEVLSKARRRPVLAKIHGSLDAPDSMIATIRDVTLVRRSPGILFLEKTLKRFDLWVIGYSGADLDIAPVLARSSRRLIWNVFPGERPPILVELQSVLGKRLATTHGSAASVLSQVARSLSVPVTRVETYECRAIHEALSKDVKRLLGQASITQRLNLLGELLNNIGAWGESKLVWSVALARTPNKDRAGRAKILNNLAVICGRQGLWSEGYRYARQSLQIKESLGDIVGLGSAYQTLGNYLLQGKRYPEAAAAYCRSILCKLQLEDKTAMRLIAISHSIHGLGRVLKELRLYEAAGALYEQAERLRHEGVEPDSIQTLRSSAISLVCRSLDKLEKAIQLAKLYGERAERREAERMFAALKRTVAAPRPRSKR